MRGPGGDLIRLHGLRVVGTHGVLPEEKRRAQPFEVDLDLSVDLTAAGASDHLADTVDYAGMAEQAAAIIASRISVPGARLSVWCATCAAAAPGWPRPAPCHIRPP